MRIRVLYNVSEGVNKIAADERDKSAQVGEELRREERVRVGRLVVVGARAGDARGGGELRELHAASDEPEEEPGLLEQRRARPSRGRCQQRELLVQRLSTYTTQKTLLEPIYEYS